MNMSQEFPPRPQYPPGITNLDKLEVLSELSGPVRASRASAQYALHDYARGPVRGDHVQIQADQGGGLHVFANTLLATPPSLLQQQFLFRVETLPLLPNADQVRELDDGDLHPRRVPRSLAQLLLTPHPGEHASRVLLDLPVLRSRRVAEHVPQLVLYIEVGRAGVRAVDAASSEAAPVGIQTLRRLAEVEQQLLCVDVGIGVGEGAGGIGRTVFVCRCRNRSWRRSWADHLGRAEETAG